MLLVMNPHIYIAKTARYGWIFTLSLIGLGWSIGANAAHDPVEPSKGNSMLQKVRGELWAELTSADVTADWGEHLKSFQTNKVFNKEAYAKELGQWIEQCLIQDDYAGAEQHVRDYVAFVEDYFSTESPEYFSSLLFQGWMHQAKGDWSGAKMKYDEALELSERIASINKRHLVYAYHNTASLLQDIGFYDAAREMMDKGIQIWKESWGVSHALFCHLEIELSDVYLGLNEPDEAEALVSGVLRKLRAVDKDHALQKAAKGQLAKVKRVQGKNEEAFGYAMHRCERVEKKRV